MNISHYILIIFLSILLLVLQINLWTGKGSMQDVGQLEQSIAIQTAKNQKLRERNLALLAEVKDLKRGLEAIDERARTEFGMIHKDETFFQIVKPNGK
ncbi:MAG: cell division protein FtsB [Pseudomonadota bacterium]